MTDPGGRRRGRAGWRETLPVHGAMLALFLLAAGFHLRLGLGLLDAAFVTMLLAGLPALSVVQLSLLRTIDIDQVERVRAYAGSAVTIGVLASAALLLGGLGPGLGTMGLEPVAWELALRTTGALSAAAVVLLALFHLVGLKTGLSETRLLKRLIPRTGPERTVFAGLSVVAGLGEEIAYRGYLLAVLSPVFGDPWTALGVSSAAFGLLLAYQGPVGIVRTALLGAVFAASLVMSGTLWPAVAVHTVVDLAGGLWLGPRLLLREGEPPHST
jgi:membrane protease YdiL (CAAX protease family)